MPQPINTPAPTVAVAYDSCGQRQVKQFANAYEARRFYANKAKAGKRPAVTKGDATMSATKQASKAPVTKKASKPATKPTKAAQAADAKPATTTEATSAEPVAKAEATATVKDAFRSRPGSQAHDINKCLSSKPVTVEAIVAKCPSTNAARVRGHLQRLLTDKLIVSTDDGYVVAKPKK